MKKIYSVSQVNSYIRGVFENDFTLNSIYIKGELSNVKYHSSGHIYFTLKDGRGAIAGVMFAGNQSKLTFRMQEGQQVVVGGTIGVYERDGKYQIYASEMIQEGSGQLYEKYEKLKKELEEMGMFAEEYKQKIPIYINTLGVVTAATGAAIQDIINIAKRRNPYVQIILFPAKVQGEGAADSIVKGIHVLERAGVDTIIVGRGGGSIEDLWAFNEEIVVRAIFDCSVPVISAVGHETDTTIADWVADLRAPTPSAAAELAVFSYGEFAGKCFDYHSKLNHLFKKELNLYKNINEKYRMRLTHLSPFHQIKQKRLQSMDLEEKLKDAMSQKLKERRHLLELYIEQMKGLSPLEKLNQGFAFAQTMEGNPVTDVGKVKIGDRLKIQIKNGCLETEVLGIEGVVR